MGLPTTRATDPVARARLLARIREAVLSGAPAPQQPRQVVSESWRRSLAARVDPERGTGPPTIFERGEMSEIRAEHPLAETLPLLRETLVAIADEAMHMMIVTDAQGHILWREGQSDVLRRADKVGLIEGTRWSEDAAAAAYRGELRPGSEAPAVIEERELLAATLRRAVLDQGDVEAMWLLAETASGADDVELAERLSHALPPSDPRHATMAARAEHLAR